MKRQQAASTPGDTAIASQLVKLWSRLTWDDVEEWAGSRSIQRGRAYQRSGHVRQLGISADGRLLADVIGSEGYITSVRRTEGEQSWVKDRKSVV